ncbi:hypothetical protein SAMN02745166_02213 [Prosthecobacter debontii]|uniref:Uncharacterized protein n=1 Tax=Prosthecobacter debontii TaxID=48467 RepID=A0A1T4Y0L1_9BACT|nr:hypothetical protein SAMN02745166_02213 [Prosthecobacter debontii]
MKKGGMRLITICEHKFTNGQPTLVSELTNTLFTGLFSQLL